MGDTRERYQLDEIMNLLEKNGFEVKQHRFAEFRYSRLAAKLVKLWRRSPGHCRYTGQKEPKSLMRLREVAA